jgi:hypothetical protein
MNNANSNLSPPENTVSGASNSQRSTSSFAFVDQFEVVGRK